MKSFEKIVFLHRKIAGAVERGRLEICCTLRGTGGSNPSFSATSDFDTRTPIDYPYTKVRKQIKKTRGASLSFFIMNL